jgi:uncharacterized protein (TIGR00297 family)
MGGFSEIPRKFVHVGVGLLALLLAWLTWWQAALLAIGAVILNAVVLPRVAPGLFRAGDLDSPADSGILLYPVSVLGLILCFPHRLEIVAAAWAILAAGDGFATIVGAHVNTRALPWNRSKSVGGLVAFILFGAAAGVFLAWWTAADLPRVATWWILTAPVVAAIVSAFVETAPIRLNDNLTVPAVSAIVLATLSLVEPAAFAARWPDAVARQPMALLLNVVVAIAGWRAGTVTPAGAITGACIGVLTFAGAGAAGWGMLIAAFLGAAIATRMGHRRKALLGIGEARGGRRGPGNAIANTGLAAWAACLALGVARADLALLAMVTALVTSSSDTIASEIGKAWGRTTRLVTTLARVAPGTSGAVSLEGTAAGVAAAAALSTVAVALDLIAPADILIVTTAATAASFVEGALGATLERSGVLDNNALNFVNAGIGTAIALGWRTIL